jgi:hypothetical protein
MRTTVTLEPDVARLIEEAMRRRRQSFKQVINDAVRRGLLPTRAREKPAPYRVEPHRARLRPGYDPRGFNKLADALDDEVIIDRMKRDSE